MALQNAAGFYEMSSLDIITPNENLSESCVKRKSSYQ